MFYYILIVLGFLGLVDTLYIYHKNQLPGPMSCPLNSNCTAVLQSKWNKFLGVKNEVWGIIYFSLIFSLGIFYILGLFSFIDLNFIILPAVILGFIYSIFLTGIQFFKIKEYCFYCLLSAGINLVLFVFAMYYYFNFSI